MEQRRSEGDPDVFLLEDLRQPLTSFGYSSLLQIGVVNYEPLAVFINTEDLVVIIDQHWQEDFSVMEVDPRHGFGHGIDDPYLIVASFLEEEKSTNNDLVI